MKAKYPNVSTVALITVIITINGQSCLAFPKFRDQIPNGHNVPNSCNRSLIWDGVGHERSDGAGPFNAFGRDFNSAGQKWTNALCQLDSDGDGKRNGEELGDPNCVWTPGQTPAVTNTTLLSHPGVCEPLSTPGCQMKNTFLPVTEACAAYVNKTDWCPAISGKDVKKLVLRLQEVTLPANDTSYLCQAFELPSDDNYQIIAYEPLISNVEIMHHMASWVCGPEEAKSLGSAFKTPASCGMVPVCSAASMVWAFGMPPRCYDNKTGVPFGKSYYNKTILQIHYNNPDLKTNYVDSSGVVLYYIKKNRPQDIGALAVSQMALRIPPKTSWTVVNATGLTDNCSIAKLASNPYYNMTSMLFHVHKASVYGKVLLKKKSGQVITILDRNVSYDRPAMLIWSGADAISIEAGDSMYVECDYNTANRPNWTFFGERTSDEMCMAIIEMYPLPKGKMAMSSSKYGPYDVCTLMSKEVDHCPISEYRNILNYTQTNKSGGTFESSCSCSGSYPVASCSSECFSFLNRTGFLSMPACLNNYYMFKVLGLGISYKHPMIEYIQSQVQRCSELTNPPANGTTCQQPSSNGGTRVLGPILQLIFLLLSISRP